MTVLRDGSSGSTQMAGSSAASSLLGTGSVSTTATTCSSPAVDGSSPLDGFENIGTESSTPQPVTVSAPAVMITIGISQPRRLISATSPSLQ